MMAGGQLRCYYSTDNGITWQPDYTFYSDNQPDNNVRSPKMWVNHSRNIWVNEHVRFDHPEYSLERNKDDVYVIWSHNNSVFVKRRDNISGKWLNQVQVSIAETTGIASGCDIKTNSSHVFAFWHDTESKSLFVASAPHSQRYPKPHQPNFSFSTPVRIATSHASPDIPITIPSFENHKVSSPYLARRIRLSIWVRKV